MIRYVFEDFDGGYKVFATRELAFIEALRTLKKFYVEYDNDKQELEDYRELMKGFFENDKGFHIDELLWVHAVEYYI